MQRQTEERVEDKWSFPLTSGLWSDEQSWRPNNRTWGWCVTLDSKICHCTPLRYWMCVCLWDSFELNWFQNVLLTLLLPVFLFLLDGICNWLRPFTSFHQVRVSHGKSALCSVLPYWFRPASINTTVWSILQSQINEMFTVQIAVWLRFIHFCHIKYIYIYRFLCAFSKNR